MHLKKTKTKLMERVMPLKEKPIYMVQTIAAKYNHRVLYTPPYHPELQPIKLIWATVKGRIARAPPKNANDTVEKVIAGLNAITAKEWVSVYRHDQGFENMYAERAQESAEWLRKKGCLFK
ncbi:uncharacterized protein PITG_10515 [Phytophthora infestans T30-4]|uniref:Tc1-like transposase DDE domain-containing protein n=1 Tax=Phytophthora infestans (strain T30-4) TaxID=403677 RepID=D0NFH8_PHYIT|nr:uncharacterized protein PITG_10515 [Phytophthora infestans T30-4]EEY56967.1 hypothetical protein PITG_10515 [Phytophthora infestans T30-4]|eukprot:XP_002902295.1 hypothetical protein PITG_10515 [Phytophthora infestans T30-4]